VARSPANGDDAPASVPGFPREVLRALAASIARFVRAGLKTSWNVRWAALPKARDDVRTVLPGPEQKLIERVLT
jgi:hypothetical protein